MKNISDNSISELCSLMMDMQHEIHKYSHVSEYLPKSLIKAINQYQKKVANELERRQNENN